MIPTGTIATTKRQRVFISDHDIRDGGADVTAPVPVGSPEAAEIIRLARIDLHDKKKNRQAQIPSVGNRVTLPRREAA